MLRLLPVGLAFLRAVDAIEIEADAFRVLVVQDFDRVAVEDDDNGAGKFSKRGIGEKKEDPTYQ